MTETFLTLIASYGAYALFVTTFLSCLWVPIPTSLMMLCAGGMVAAGDLSLPPLLIAGFLGAVLGDQAGYFIGKYAAAPALERLSRSPARRAILQRARAFVDQRGGLGVFFSTWAIAPLGPYVNFVTGATGLHWLRFTLWDIAGEFIWVSSYLSMGYFFTDFISVISDALISWLGFASAIVVAIGAIIWIISSKNTSNEAAELTKN